MSLLVELASLPGVSVRFRCARGIILQTFQTNGKSIMINDGHDLAQHS